MTAVEPAIIAIFVDYFSTLPMLEWTAMLLSVAYIILVAKGSLWCWPAAFISTSLYTYIFYDVLLLMDSALHVYYLVMAVYGYWSWQKNKTAKATETTEDTGFTVISWDSKLHLKACLILAVVASVFGFLMANYTPADFPYLDTFTTVYGVFATYLVTQKVLENWLYWLVIDAISIYLYIEKGLYPTVLLFIIYVGIAFYGYIKWRNLLHNSASSTNTGNTFA
jgi:nicotinamide mononucleotide transporter